MSARLQEQAGGAVVVLPPQGRQTADEVANASLTRWVWNPYRRIDNVGGGLSLVRQIGYRGQHRYTELDRCRFYPLSNITWEEVDREQLAERHLSGLTSSGPVPKVLFTKYAGDQAFELAESYGESYGLRVFHPGLFAEDLTWVDDHDLVTLVATTIQPRAFKLHELVRELGEPAKQRIKRSKELTDEGKDLAERVRAVMVAGAVLAVREAEREHRELIKQMSDAAVGKPGLATPNDFHEWLCDQLDVPVPERVHAGPRKEAPSAALESAVALLVEREARRADAPDPRDLELAEMRERLRKLEEKPQREKPEEVTA